MDNQLIFLLRMATAVLCGALIGLERSKRQKEAGIRTHIMVTLGATLLVIVSKYGFLDVAGLPGISVDASRIASNIVTGISFLGAGVIFLKNGAVNGLTTAAGIWSTAGVGCAIVSGMYVIGIAATAMIIIIQTLLHLFIPSSENMPIIQISFKIIHTENALDKVKTRLLKSNIVIQQINIVKNIDDTMTVDLVVRTPKNVTIDSMIDIVGNDNNVLEFSMQS